MHNYFELFQENRIFEILYPPFAPFNKLDLKSKEEEEEQVALQTWQKCGCSADKFFCETGIFIFNLKCFFPLAQIPASTGESGVPQAFQAVF